MQIFSFDPSAYVDTYRSEEWVHIREGVSEEFHELLLQYAHDELQAHNLGDFAIKGKKEQSLFEFPEGMDYTTELFDVVAELCGLERAGMTLSERHIQIYEHDAAPEPPAHKDRFPSQVSVGLSIAIPAESSLVIYPYDHRGLNPFNKSADFRASLQPDELPEVVLRDAREVELDDRARDVVMFAGSNTWHLRRRAADALNLYLKFNDFGCDPLGEDPRTGELRSATLSALDSDATALDALHPVLSRRYDTASRVYLRNGDVALRAELFGEPGFGISELQFELLRSLDGGRRSLADTVTELAGRADPAEARRALVYLASQGAIELVP